MENYKQKIVFFFYKQKANIKKMSQIKKSDGNILNNLYGNNDTITSAFEKLKKCKKFFSLSEFKFTENKTQ